jgi:hypothetical protein
MAAASVKVKNMGKVLMIAKRESTPRETRDSPITQPPRIAMSYPDPMSFQHWWVHRMFVYT